MALIISSSLCSFNALAIALLLSSVSFFSLFIFSLFQALKIYIYNLLLLLLIYLLLIYLSSFLLALAETLVFSDLPALFSLLKAPGLEIILVSRGV